MHRRVLGTILGPVAALGTTAHTLDRLRMKGVNIPRSLYLRSECSRALSHVSLCMHLYPHPGLPTHPWDGARNLHVRIRMQEIILKTVTYLV